jgi:hypothetical protein
MRPAKCFEDRRARFEFPRSPARWFGLNEIEAGGVVWQEEGLGRCRNWMAVLPSGSTVGLSVIDGTRRMSVSVGGIIWIDTYLRGVLAGTFDDTGKIASPEVRTAVEGLLAIINPVVEGQYKQRLAEARERDAGNAAHSAAEKMVKQALIDETLAKAGFPPKR